MTFIYPVTLFLCAAVIVTSAVQAAGDARRGGFDDGGNAAAVSEKTGEVRSMDVNELFKIEIPVSDIERPVSSEYASFQAKRREFDAEKVKNLLLNAKETEEKLWQDGRVYTCQNDSEYLTVTSSGSVNYVTTGYLEKIEPMLSFLLNVYDEHYDAQSIMSPDDFPFMTQEEAVSKSVALLKELTGQDFELENIYVLEKKLMKEKMEEWAAYRTERNRANGREEKAPEIPKYTKADNCYFIRLRQTAGSLLLFDKSHGPDNATISGTFADVAISKDGVICLSAAVVYDVQGNNAVNKIKTAEEAIALVAEKYRDNIPLDKTTVTDMELIYVPETDDKGSGEYTLTPVWCFTTERNVSYFGDSGTIFSHILINAVTGDEIT